MSTVEKIVSLPPAEAPARVTVVRNVAVDAYRGFVMLLMMAEVLRLIPGVAGFSRKLVLAHPCL